jgi:GH24 family phage-related lysozyme (muramidase)
MAKRITTMSPMGLRWLAMLEGGHHLTAYNDRKDGKGTWTISAGVTFYSPGKQVKKGDKLVDLAASEALFRLRLAEFEGVVDAHTRDDIDQYTFDAFVDAAYNIGEPNFRTSTFVRRFNQKASIDAICQALSWFKYETIDGKSVVNKGLVERRACEIYLLRNSLYRIQGGTTLR